MGKDSLTKSTTNQKNKEKSTKKAASKTVPKKQTSAATKSASKKPAATKKKRAVVDIQTLVLKKFDSQWPPSAPISPREAASSTQSQRLPHSTLPMDDSMRALLFRRFSMAEIASAAQKPEPRSAAPPMATPDPHPWPAADTPGQDQGGTGGPTDRPPFGPIPSDPVIRAMVFGAAAFLVILILLIGASLRNNAKYYLVTGKDAVEIWQGQFSPMGKKFFGILHNYRLTDTPKPSYAKQEIFPVIFDYYLEKADNLLDLQSPPDFQAMINYLNTAKQYALSKKMKTAIDVRLNTIERLTLLYKADVAITRENRESLESATQYLMEAKGLTSDSGQLQLIEDKLDQVKIKLDALPPTAIAPDTAAPDAAPEAATNAGASATASESEPTPADAQGSGPDSAGPNSDPAPVTTVSNH